MPYVNQSSPEQDEQDDAELLDIFLEEAREVTENGLAAVQEPEGQSDRRDKEQNN